MRRFALIATTLAFIVAMTIGTARSSPSAVATQRPQKTSIEEVLRRQDGAIDFLLDRLEGKNDNGRFVR